MSRYRGMRYTRVWDSRTRFKESRTEESTSYGEVNRTAEGVALTAISSGPVNISLSYRTATGLCSVRSRGGRSNTQCHARTRTHAKRRVRSIADNPQQIGIKELISFRGRRGYPMRRDTRRVGQ